MSEPHRVISHEMSMVRTLRGSPGPALAGLAVVAGVSWIYLASGAGLGSAMQGMDMSGGGMMPMAPAWTPRYAALMLGMWTVMMTAMMLPSAAPAVLRVAGQVGSGHDDAIGGPGQAAGFAAGYLAVLGRVRRCSNHAPVGARLRASPLGGDGGPERDARRPRGGSRRSLPVEPIP